MLYCFQPIRAHKIIERYNITDYYAACTIVDLSFHSVPILKLEHNFCALSASQLINNGALIPFCGNIIITFIMVVFVATHFPLTKVSSVWSFSLQLISH